MKLGLYQGKGDANLQGLFLAIFKPLKYMEIATIPHHDPEVCSAEWVSGVARQAGQRRTPGSGNDPEDGSMLGQEVDQACLLFPVSCTDKD
jgi:hypothetical protein